MVVFSSSSHSQTVP
jgi:hypothetical protein